MRQWTSLGLGAALGLAIAMPVSAQTVNNTAGAHPTHVPIGRLCETCAKKLPKRIPVVVEQTPSGTNSGATPCAACEAAHGPTTVSVPTGPNSLMLQEEAPGYASVGGGSGQVAPRGEPAPIGVMRTNYSVPAPMPSRVPMAAGMPASGPGPIAPQQQAQALIPPPTPNTSKKRPWVLGSMLGISRRNAMNAY